MTVAENMGFGLRMQRTPKTEIRSRVEEAAKTLGLVEHLDRKPRNLSGGQRQRVAMGRAIVREPQAFLMDEPLSNLDAKLRVQMRAEISRIQRTFRVTTIYVTHDQIEAMTMGDRVAVLKDGILQQVAEPQELFERPASLFVGGFIGSPAMNMVEARLERDEQGFWVRFGSHRLLLERGLLEHRPALATHEGRQVVVGLRPESMQDRALVPDAAEETCIRSRVELRESLGSEVLVHFAIDAPPVLTEDTRELAVDRGDLEPILDRDKSTDFVARFDAASHAGEGDDVEIVINTMRLHLFDPDSGLAIFR